MKKILLALLLLPAIGMMGWTIIGTNLLGTRLGSSIKGDASTDQYAVTYDYATRSYKLAAGGGGGGGISTINGGTGIQAVTVGTTTTVTNTGVVSVTAGANITNTGTAANPILNASVSGSGINGTINGAGSTALTTVNVTGTLLGSKSSISGSTVNVSLDQIVNADVATGAAIAYAKLSLTGNIVNADIAGAAAIAYAKLALTGSIVNADVSASAAIAYSKLALATSIVNGDISGSAAIAYSKLALTGSIVNADVSASAAIAYSKLALSNSVVVADIAAAAKTGSGKVVLDTGATIGTPTLAFGSDADGDLYERISGAGGRLAKGSNSTVLQVSSGGVLQYSTITNAMIAAAAGIPYSKLTLTASITDADVAAANKDGSAGTASMRTIGTGAAQSCGGADIRLPPTPTAIGKLVVDNLTGYAETAAGLSAQVLLGVTGAAPGWANLSALFNAGTAISITGTSPLTIANTGVASILAGNRTAVSGATGNVTTSESAFTERCNQIINGDYQVWTQGTTTNTGDTSRSLSGASDVYVCDRMIGNAGTTGAATVARTAFTPGQVSVPNEPFYYADWNQTSGGTGTVQMAQKILGVNTFAGQTATVSVYLSVSSGSISVTPQITQNFGTGGSPSSVVVTTGSAWTVNSSTFSRFTYTFTVPSISGKTLGTTFNTSYLELQLLWPTSSTFHAQIADVQFELGPAATSYQRRPYSAELFDCQYFHQRLAATVNFMLYATGSASGTTTPIGNIVFVRHMRVPPTMTSSAGNTFQVVNGATIVACSSSNTFAFTSTIFSEIVLTSTGLTAGACYIIRDNNVATSYVDMNAEL